MRNKFYYRIEHPDRGRGKGLVVKNSTPLA